MLYPQPAARMSGPSLTLMLLLAMGGTSQAQGLVKGMQDGAQAGNKAAGPVGGVLGGAIGGVVGDHYGIAGGQVVFVGFRFDFQFRVGLAKAGHVFGFVEVLAAG